jgi:hypothetical protein
MLLFRLRASKTSSRDLSVLEVASWAVSGTNSSDSVRLISSLVHIHKAAQPLSCLCFVGIQVTMASCEAENWKKGSGKCSCERAYGLGLCCTGRLFEI